MRFPGIRLPQSRFRRWLVFGSILFWLAIAVAVAFVVFASRSGSSAEEIVGVLLPATAKDVRASDRAGMFGGDYYVSAIISREEYRQFVAKLGLRHRADLLQYWSSALAAHEIPWWRVSQVNDDDTYFGDGEESTFIVTRYEDGRIFFKRHVY